MIISEEDYLAHYGVKGMHWGIRKKPITQTRSYKRTQKLMAKRDKKIAKYRSKGMTAKAASKRYSRNQFGKAVALGVGGYIGSQYVRDLSMHAATAYLNNQTYPHTQYAPHQNARTTDIINGAIKATMKAARSATDGAKMHFDQTGRVTYYPPGATYPMRPNFDPMFNRTPISPTRRALNP